MDSVWLVFASIGASMGHVVQVMATNPNLAVAAALASGILLRLAGLWRHRAVSTEVTDTPAAAPSSDPGSATSAAEENRLALLVCNGRRSAVREAFRGLRTQLLLLAEEGALRSLLVTSAGPGEGKTTVAANVAIAAAQAGKHVLLVDADLHRPRLHHVFEQSNSLGLADLLQREGEAELPSKITALIRATSVPNLALLPAGVLPRDAREIFEGGITRQVVTTLSAAYDLVVYDTPPVLSVADPTVLSAYVDGVLLVIRAGQYPRDAILQAHAELTAVHAKVIGAVLNGVQVGSGGAYYGHYQYPYYT